MRGPIEAAPFRQRLLTDRLALLGCIFADQMAPNPLASDGSSDRLQGDRLQGDRLQGDRLQGDGLQVSSGNHSPKAHDWNQILFSKSLPNSSNSRNTSSAALHYLIAG